MSVPQPRRLQVKLFFKGESIPPLSTFVPVFHRWIQRKALDQLLIDVHNYAHVHHGTGILLVGHEGDYAIDLAGGRAGLVYRLKRGDHRTLSEALRVALVRAAQGGLLLSGDPSLKGKVDIETGGFEIAVPDRLGFPNRTETFRGIQDDLSSVIRQVSRETNVSVARIDNDAREPLAIRATMPSEPPLSALAAATEAAGIV